MNLFAEEVRRILSRRVVWVLVGLALAGVAVIGVVAFLNADPPGLQYEQLWPRNPNGDPGLTPAIALLAVGGLIGGASIVGAEWRSNTMATLLLWEPRRPRVVFARLAAIAGLATIIAFVLEIVLALGLLPAAVFRGSMAGVDARWLTAALLAGARGAAVAGLAAIMGGAIAFVGRHTAAALGAVFMYFAIVEQVVRGFWPWMTRWLTGSNLAVLVLGRLPADAPFRRSVVLAAATLGGYVAAMVAAAVAATSIRDVPTS